MPVKVAAMQSSIFCETETVAPEFGMARQGRTEKPLDCVLRLRRAGWGFGLGRFELHSVQL